MYLTVGPEGLMNKIHKAFIIWPMFVDNHDSAYLGMALMAVQLFVHYVQAHIGDYHIFDPEGTQPKSDGTTEIHALFYRYEHNLNL